MYWFIKVMKQAFDFSSRARRTEYWVFILFTFIISFVLAITEAFFGLEVTEDIGPLTGIFYLIILLPSISLTVRRLHDIGRSGWWILIGLIPVIGNITLFVFSLLDSQQGTNNYGPNPKNHFEK